MGSRIRAVSRATAAYIWSHRPLTAQSSHRYIQLATATPLSALLYSAVLHITSLLTNTHLYPALSYIPHLLSSPSLGEGFMCDTCCFSWWRTGRYLWLRDCIICWWLVSVCVCRGLTVRDSHLVFHNPSLEDLSSDHSYMLPGTTRECLPKPGNFFSMNRYSTVQKQSPWFRSPFIVEYTIVHNDNSIAYHFRTFQSVADLWVRMNNYLTKCLWLP